MIEVIIADGHPLIREGIEKVLIQGNLDVSISAKVSNAEDLLNRLKTDAADIVILDISLPKKSGLDVLKDINQLYNDLPVLILSMHPAKRFAIRSFKIGAYGYLNKESIAQKLVEAVDHIVKKKYISDSVAEQLAMHLNQTKEPGPPHRRLSDREFQVMCMIASGKTIEEIAEELSLSSRTIHTYRSRLMEKMDMKSNVAITRYALENRLIE